MDEAPGGTHINDLEATCMTIIFSFLDGRECSIAGVVDKHWHQVSTDELLWRQYMKETWDQDEPIGPAWARLPSYRAAYIAWHVAFPDETQRGYLRRAARAWRSIKTWLFQNLPEAEASLQPGASAEAVAAVEEELRSPLPPALKAIYMLHDGQALRHDSELDARQKVPGAAEMLTAVKQRDAAFAAEREARRAAAAGEAAAPPRPDAPTRGPHASLFWGIFGGYSFYDHLVVTRMLPLKRAVFWTRFLRDRGQLSGDQGASSLIVAASFNFHKIFLADLKDGSISVVTGRQTLMPAVPAFVAAPAPAAAATAASGNTMAAAAAGLEDARMSGGGEPAGAEEAGSSGAGGSGSSGAGTAGGAAAAGAGAASASSSSSKASDASAGQQDGVLRWFEEYGRRLDQGWYEVAALDEDFPSKAICLFPLQPPGMRVAVTRGVCVRATTLYAPEASIPGTRNLFTYSIRFSLLTPDDQVEHWPPTAGKARVLPSAQLMARHWVIRDGAGAMVDEIRGEAVIGKYPLLAAGGPEFVYQSCTHQPGPAGSMEGDFKFVEGSIQAPSGSEWDVECPRFDLAIPDFIF
mmetsp:Transcript_29991/g.76373  ORF Transcript_29991/g.76373 Transcript_29991/m.76373 type:complete len:579 (-) Transcript_29991:483-2219(-)|eukprot:CAMPEP_0202860404 /NCGR_PEP_ID=MMETSP1391-20130828/2119_1 /ASSEMBLY_ACC=CAM_ASM_000867 /TAXON_ID=1034604 /ORGANISM="Chlamydomonas leiostraca, Strain SAG 11-49" /LENGTH=578 /DNA_ID=CAMNT_0049539561 /DNA_START=106 /DNA_END=1842 /DNA_ORIENTATION=+